MESKTIPYFHSLEMTHPIWERFFQVFPLTLIGSKEPDGNYDLAPKHMAMPMSWQHYFGFVCAPTHGTYQNIQREGYFTVSYPRPQQVVMTSLSASPRQCDDSKPTVTALPTIPSLHGDGIFLKDAYLYLECTLDRFVDHLGPNSLIIGKVIAAHVHEEMLLQEENSEEQIHNHPLLAYLHPRRFATIQDSLAFPMPAGFKR
ncbi:MAG: flavin reductase [Myxococcales bacterium]|nr:flavin reductase [Myxococcales bacterium]